MISDADLEAFHDPQPTPADWTRQADKIARLRAAALHALATSDNGRRLHPDARKWAEHWANYQKDKP